MVLDLVAKKFVDDPRSREDMVTEDYDAEVEAFEREAAAEERFKAPDGGPDVLPDDFEDVADGS